MKNKLKGIIFFSKKIKDNDLYIRILTSNDNVVSGLVYGGNSSKKKLIYQNGYFIEFYISQKNENLPPSFNAEISKPYIGVVFDDRYKLSALISILSLINLSIVEGQYIKGLYHTISNLIENIVNRKHWIIIYCEWLFELLKLIGYQIDYKKNTKRKYFNIYTQDFSNKVEEKNIVFPHNLFSERKELTFHNINLIFIIFESIFVKNHLEHINYKMPLSFSNFKNIILQNLKVN